MIGTAPGGARGWGSRGGAGTTVMGREREARPRVRNDCVLAHGGWVVGVAWRLVSPRTDARQPAERALQSRPDIMTFLKNSYSMVVVLALALGGAAGAAPRRVVVASGDCKDAELSGQTKALYDKLVARPGENVLGAADFAERLFPQPSGSFEDIKRQLEAAQGQFYEARYAKAAQALDEVLRQVARLPPGEARWKLYVDAQLLQAMNHRSQGKVKESDDAFRNVLRLEPKYTLDPDYYTPSTRQAFDKLRRELARAKKVKLSVKSNLSPSEVFLEGRERGADAAGAGGARRRV